MGVAVEAVVEAGEEGANDEDYDSQVVELISKRGHGVGVVRDCVEGGGQAEACRGGYEEGGECQEVGGGGGDIAGREDGVEVCREEEEEDGAQEVRVDVDRLVVEVEEGADGAFVGGGGWAVSAEDVGIVPGAQG